METKSYSRFQPRVIAVDTQRVIPADGISSRTTIFYELELIAGNISGLEYREDGIVPLKIGTIFLRRPGTVVRRSGIYRYYIFTFDCVDDPEYRDKYEMENHSLDHSQKDAPIYAPSTHFSPLLDSLPEMFSFPDPDPYLVHFENAFHHIISRRLDSGRRASSDQLVQKELVSIIRLLLHDSQGNADALDSNISQTMWEIKYYIENHFGQPITLQTLSDQTSVCKEYLCRQFRKLFDCSPMKYLLKVRIQRAQYLLANTSKTVALIAAECGFSNEQYFYLKFKEILGVTPAGFRSGCVPEIRAQPVRDSFAAPAARDTDSLDFNE